MSWLAVTRTDLRVSVRAPELWGLTACVALGLGALAHAMAGVQGATANDFLDVVASGLTLGLPLLSIVVGYDAVVGELESGTAALVLSLPNSRWEMAVGKLLGRLIVLAGILAIGMAVATLVVSIRFATSELGQLWFGTAAILGYGYVFVGLAVGLSMLGSTSRAVIGSAFGIYIVLVTFWTDLIDGVVAVMHGGAPRPTPSWAPFLKFLSPRPSFNYLLEATLGIGRSSALQVFDGHWFATIGGACLVLVSWFLVPVIFGYLRFSRQDI